MKHSPWVGYSIAPIIGPMLYGVTILFIPSTYENNEFNMEAWVISLALFIIASYATCLIIGAPLIFLLRKYQKLNIIWFSTLGSFLYALVINYVLFIAMKPTIIGSIYFVILKATLSGLVLGLSIVAVYSYITGITSKSSSPAKNAGLDRP